MTMFSPRNLKLLFASVFGLRLGALALTLYALSQPGRYIELNPVVSPVFKSIGIDGASVLYTVILLFALLLVNDSVAKTHPRAYPFAFGIYYIILGESLFDFNNDLLQLASLTAYSTDITIITTLTLIQGAGIIAGKVLLSKRHLDHPTLGQTFAVSVLMWPVLLYSKMLGRRS